MAALEWSLSDSALGLQMLRLLARPWLAAGRQAAAIPAIDRLLTNENARVHPEAWVAAAVEAGDVLETAGLWDAEVALAMQAQNLAPELGDVPLLAVVGGGALTDIEVLLEARDQATSMGDRYRVAVLTIFLVFLLLDADPTAAHALLAQPDLSAAAQESTFLGGLVTYVRSVAERGAGDVREALRLAVELMISTSLASVDGGVWATYRAAFLAGDEAAIGDAVGGRPPPVGTLRPDRSRGSDR